MYRSTGPPPFAVREGERFYVAQKSDYAHDNDWTGFEGEEGTVARTPDRTSRARHSSYTMGGRFPGRTQSKTVVLDGGCIIEWLDRDAYGNYVGPNADSNNGGAPASTSHTHKGETVFVVTTATTKAGVVGQVLYANTSRIVWESEPQSAQVNDEGVTVKSAANVATEVANAKIDEVVDGLFA